MTVSLILPCYNPPQGWEENIVTNYTAFCRKIKQPAELIVVLDGESRSLAADSVPHLQQLIPGVQVIAYATNMGKGHAIREGVKIAKGDIILYTDIDFPYTIESMFSIYSGLLKNEYDLGVGIKDDAYYKHVPVARKFISRLLRAMIRVCLSIPITDTQCGLKGFRCILKPRFLQTGINRYLFDLEFIRNCYKDKKIRIKAIPVTLNEQVHFRKMNYSILLPEMLNFAALLFKKPNG